MTIDRLLLGLAVLLAGSLGLNILGANAYLHQRDALATARSGEAQAQGDAVQARAAADACSQAVAELGEAAKLLEQERNAARQAAAKASAGHYARADAVLAAAPAVPGNVCASAQARAAGWLAERKTGGD